MKLQLLIPQYDETEEVIKPLLDSIEIQQNIDFKDIGVIIVNDGSDVRLSKEFLDGYSFKIEYSLNEHKGVSATRNACLDKATADYVMFCDADDMFYSPCAIWFIIQEINTDNGDGTTGFDSMLTLFVEESRDPVTKQVIYINREMDSTFVHGKVHRRKYLLDNNIRWNDNLTIHEDSYFNILCQNLSTRVKYTPTPLYLWRWRDNSVCRHDPKYILKTYINLIDSNDALIEEFFNREKQDKALFYITFLIFDAYYTMNKPEWINQENKEYRDSTEKRFSEYYKKYKNYWKIVPNADKMQVSQGIRERSVMEGMEMETITINEWLKHIENLQEATE